MWKFSMNYQSHLQFPDESVLGRKTERGHVCGVEKADTRSRDVRKRQDPQEPRIMNQKLWRTNGLAM